MKKLIENGIFMYASVCVNLTARTVNIMHYCVLIESLKDGIVGHT